MPRRQVYYRCAGFGVFFFSSGSHRRKVNTVVGLLRVLISQQFIIYCKLEGAPTVVGGDEFKRNGITRFKPVVP